MGSVVQLADATLAVEPGRSASTTVTVRNTGSVVDRFSFQGLGPAAEWMTFEPETLSLFPQATGTVNMAVAPPRSSAVAAGTSPFGVKVVSSEDPEGSTAEEGTLEVGAFSDVSLELLPRIVHGRYMAAARLAVDNRSNIPYDGELSGADAAEAMQVQFRPGAVTVPPGGAQIVRMRLRPVKRFWRGVQVTKPFQVSVANSDPRHPPRLQADGSLVQEALLPGWLMGLLAALVALAVLLVILWYALFKPEIRSTAKDAVHKQLAAAGITPAAASSPAPAAGGGSGGGSGGGGGGGGGATTPSSVATATQAVGSPAPAGTPALTVNGSGTANGNGSQTIYTVPSGHTLQITDLLLQNAAGDAGTLSIARNGTVLMQWAMADFRDLDYHWVSPTLFGPGTKLVMTVAGCTNACHPGVYYAGQLVSG